MAQESQAVFQGRRQLQFGHARLKKRRHLRMDLVQDGRGPVQLGQLVSALYHALDSDQRREVDDGLSGKELLL